jgi:hypothetical protein
VRSGRENSSQARTKKDLRRRSLYFYFFKVHQVIPFDMDLLEDAELKNSLDNFLDADDGVKLIYKKRDFIR